MVSIYLPMKSLKQTWLMVIYTLLVASGMANAQADNTIGRTENTESSTKLIEATQQYKTSSRELLTIQEGQVDKATAELDELRMLVAEGLVAKAELETGEQVLAGLRAQLEATKKQITDSDHLIAEIQKEKEFAQAAAATPAKIPVKMVAKQYGAFTTTATILGYSGAAPWSIGGLSGIQSFFSATFSRALPTSAIGQSATHNRLGYDHRNAVDVALHPDSAEGKSLINYLQSRGIPFLAFRTAIPGVATGPHIHIGSPSHRLS
jgi:TolA-binding protein